LVDGSRRTTQGRVETIEKVIETGQDPKRFREDLLRRS